MRKSIVLLACIIVICGWISAGKLYAEVSRIEITERTAFADGMSFGKVGPYEKIRGRLHYAVDPENESNAQIVDLQYAPRNADGLVEFEGDFVLLKPVDLERGNHRLLYDVNNRGGLRMLAYFNSARGSNNPSTVEHAGNGFLMRQGYSLLWCAWNWDVTPGTDKMQIDLPIATKNGQTITALINAELSIVSSETKVQKFAWGGSRCYEVVNPEDNSTATLTVRDEPMGQRREIPRDRWRFGLLEGENVVADSTNVYFEDGFQPGKIYELLYVAKDPRVVGLGLAAIRDAISFFHFETEDRVGTPNPLAESDQERLSKPDPEFAYIFGISQSGRVTVHMIYQGFHVDEKGRMVFEGAWPHVAGGGKGGFNFRFAQTTHHPSHIEGNYFPADYFPFNYNLQQDPVTGRTGDVLEVAKKKGKIPYIFVTNHALEYWTRSASLIHTDVTGMEDAMLYKRRKIRMYMVNGAPHGAGRSRTGPRYEHLLSVIDQRPVGRALLVALDRWVSQGIQPPDNAIPLIAEGELVTSEEHQRRFPKIPEMRHPGTSLKPPRVDYGPRFWTEGIQDIVPPKYFGPRYATLVPNFDSDGNGLGGIRLPDVSVPLGTYQGWNPRKPESGAPNYLARFAGSFWMFPLTEEERARTKDPRPSIEARYPSQQDYVSKVDASAQQLLEDGFLLEEDKEEIIARTRNMAWPPEPTENRPFWKMKN